MARKIRIEYPGALYHLTSRGNARQSIFINDDDRNAFLSILDDVILEHQWACYAYCLMDNHYHLLIETPEGNLAAGMQRLNSVYSSKFNKRHQRVGHVLQGRYDARVVEKESYLLKVARYIVLNPVRAGMVQRPDDWFWSSYRQTAGLSSGRSLLKTDWLLTQFGPDQASARQNYKDFVASGEGTESPFGRTQNSLILGGPEFVEQIGAGQSSLFCSDGTVESRYLGRESLEFIFDTAQSKIDRDERIVYAKIVCGYTIKQISSYLALHRTTVSKVLNENRHFTV